MQGLCKHEKRWVPRHVAGRLDEEDGHVNQAAAVDMQMLVKYPADLAWSGLACKVSWLMRHICLSKALERADGDPACA